MREPSYTLPPDARCLALAERQHGAIHRSQAIELGMTSAAIGRRVASGRWRRFLPGVYLVCGVPVSCMTRVMAACLWGGPGTVASHRSAAGLWGLIPLDTNLIEISSGRRVSSATVIVHHARLSGPDVTYHEGIPITSIHRTLIDLGDVASPHRVEEALDSAVGRGLTSRAWLIKELRRIGVQGRRGAGTLLDLLDGAGSGRARPSWLERRFIRLLKTSWLPRYVREHPVRSGRRSIDFAWPEVGLGVEVHGAKWHFSRRKWGQDLARHNELTSEGWTILHTTWARIDEDGAAVIAEIEATYSRLRGLHERSR